MADRAVAGPPIAHVLAYLPERESSRSGGAERSQGGMNLLTTYAGSLMEGFLPQGWDLAKIDACCAHPPEAIHERRPWWHPGFEPVACAALADFDVMLGHEIALTIRRTRDQGRPVALILP